MFGVGTPGGLGVEVTFDCLRDRERVCRRREGLRLHCFLCEDRVLALADFVLGLLGARACFGDFNFRVRTRAYVAPLFAARAAQNPGFSFAADLQLQAGDAPDRVGIRRPQPVKRPAVPFAWQALLWLKTCRVPANPTK